jgi:hypothetical protein
LLIDRISYVAPPPTRNAQQELSTWVKVTIFEQLKAEMIERSREQEWNQAKLEWDLEDVFRVSEERDCLCGHNPILQICTLRNQLTRQTAEVGNVCVERFLGMRSKRIFSAIKRIRDDENRSLNKEAIGIFAS